MCRNIKTLANFAPPATDDEIHAQAYLVRRSGNLTSSPIHEVYEIVGWG